MTLIQKDFVQIYEKVPRLCVDLAITNREGVLLAFRSTEPFINMWTLPGGTLYKNERVEEAGVRIAKKETGLDVKIGKCLGFSESFEEKRFGSNIHSVSVVMEANIIGGGLLHDENAKELKFFKELPIPTISCQSELIKNITDSLKSLSLPGDF